MADLYRLNPGYSKRDCLLPPGCKDLIDVLNLPRRQGLSDEMLPFLAPKPTLPVHGIRVKLRSSTKVQDLAEILQVKLFEIIAALMQLGVFASMNQVVDFDSASKLLAKYGLCSTKAP